MPDTSFHHSASLEGRVQALEIIVQFLARFVAQNVEPDSEYGRRVAKLLAKTVFIEENQAKLDAFFAGHAFDFGQFEKRRKGGGTDPTPAPPDIRTPEEEQEERDRTAMMESLVDTVAASTILATRAVNRDTSKMADTDIIAIARGLPKAYRVWAPGGVYDSGEWFWYPEAGAILYEQRQPGPVTGQEHQPPGDENMYAVYRPVDPAAGTEDDPKALVLGMTAKVGEYFVWAGALWKCLRPIDVVFRSREPGAAGMESYWERVRDV